MMSCIIEERMRHTYLICVIDVLCCVFFRIYLFIFNLIICVGIFCLLVFVYSVCMQCPRELEEGVRSLGSGVTDVGLFSVENLRTVF